ncbi:MAG: hypothetical protein PHR13_12030 [Dysgonamonadaceae bacterium]|nr:hypothetical protein [Dysgonamonadaceae bacterium]
MCKMLLSVNPEHVDNILSGVKQFEFRKVRCKRDVESILIYATSPVMLVVGEAEVREVIEGAPESVWKLTTDFAGVSKPFFDRYYKNKKKAIAYRLGKVERYLQPLPLSAFGISFAPQSFVYV